MTDWRADYLGPLLDRQRHISQKLAQLRELRVLVRKWRELVAQYERWFEGLGDAAAGSRYFSVESLIRMTGLLTELQTLVGEFQQVGDPKTTGTGAAGSLPSGGAPAPSDAGTMAEWLTDLAGPLASTAPWHLAWTLDPETSGSIMQGELGAAFTNMVLNPFTAAGHFIYFDEMIDLSDDLIESHQEELDTLFESWHDARRAITDIGDALDQIDDATLEHLEDELEGILADYEATFDGAPGENETSAAGLRQAATRGATHR
jgi:hypothetical protein